jgi:acyl carrier protein
MPATEEIRREVIGIVAGIAEVEPDEVSDDASLEQLGIDSLGGLRLVAAVEKRFCVVIDESEIAGIRTMQDVFALVRRHTAEA